VSVQPKVRVLIVDDSAIARDLLERGLSADPGIEVVGKASDVFAARDKIVFLKPDVMTLDVEMPRMDGIEFLKRLIPQYPIPTVVVSAVTADGSRRAMEALSAGALEVVAKPSGGDRNALAAMIADLADKVKSAAGADPSKIRIAASAAARPAGAGPASRAPKSGDRLSRRLGRTAVSVSSSAECGVVAIGASTGGTTALHRIVENLPADMPPIVVVQHMPPVFTRMFSDALDRSSAVHVFEAEDGMPLVPGTVLVAPGDKHLRVVRVRDEYRVSCGDGPKVSGHCPSVDVLFSSVAETFASRAVGVLLTGMGRDGAAGLLSMRSAGARCVAQDEASSVVWGMPREAWENGAAEKLVPLDDMARELAVLSGKEAAWASRR
jgi:two-component system chemotaxis response regulator CheB